MALQPQASLADLEIQGTIDALDATLELDCNGVSGGKGVISGTWIGTIKFEQSIDGTRWDNVGTFSGTTGAVLSSTGTTTNDIVVFVGIAGVSKIRARFHSYTSGTATITLRASNGVSNVFVDNLVAAVLKATAFLNDGAGNAITSQAAGAKRPLDSGLIGPDGTQIGNATDRLKVDAQITSTEIGAATTFSSKTKVVVLTDDVTIATGGGYTTVYTYSGSGLLLGFNVEFNNTDIVLKLVVDGDTVFDGTSINALNGFLVSSNSTDRRQSGSGIVTSGATLDWSLKQPIRYNSSVTISASTGGGLLPRTFQQGIIYLTKET